ncbi:hypothetical protein [Streptomyces oceani]|uniref:DUF2771 domain-containing protein n=1 Tax=Streptomyces oceani TaxID=1075402 RepID=A0A1E7KLP1_9ACTN|nr:hypothetical protein [Streptomyces oceani]OEV04889.1 hypothetical protein AN216_05205 [Streptomyces oceani]
MTNALSGSRRGLRTATAIGTVTLGMLALAACEKPTPLMTVTVGSDTVTAEAACYEDGAVLDDAKANACSKKDDAEQTITVDKDEKIRIGVEPDMAEDGWLLLVNNQPVLSEPSDETYLTFPGEAFFQKQGPTGTPVPTESAKITVVQTADKKVKGVWQVQAKQD